MLFGAHVSIAGGIQNAPLHAGELGCEVFQMFTRSPQGGHVPPLDEKTVREFKNGCEYAKQKEWYIHAPFFINFASGNPRIKYGSISTIRQELERGSLLEAKYLMVHLGSYKDLGQTLGAVQVVEALEETLKGYKGTTQLLVEISAGAGEIIGDTFEEIAEIVNHKKLKKYNIGVCYDTQHGFASGYDMRTPQAVKNTLEKFDKIIGLDKLKMSHCNDSLTEFGSHKDRHAHIGEGLIGLAGFEALLKNPKLKNINFVLETEHDKVVDDINILKRIRGTI